MSKLSEYVDQLPVAEDLGDGIVKIANLRQFVMCLPTPENCERDETLIPDLDMKLILSVSLTLPRYISEKIQKSPDKIIFDDISLGGLCVSGRGLPIEIFLHSFLLNKDPKGELFDEIAWHETVHAIEGIYLDEDGEYKRENTPWSYVLQQNMIDKDSEKKFQRFMISTEKDPVIIRRLLYLKHGTDLQENVSEIFARVAVLCMKNIRDKGQAIDRDGKNFLEREINGLNFTSRDADARNIQTTLRHFRAAARDVLWQNADEMVERANLLYGCKAAPQEGPGF